jgi:hypothetical protein
LLCRADKHNDSNIYRWLFWLSLPQVPGTLVQLEGLIPISPVSVPPQKKDQRLCQRKRAKYELEFM